MGCLLRFTIAAVGVGALFVVWVYAYTNTPLIEGTGGTRTKLRARITASAGRDRRSLGEAAERFARRLMAPVGTRLVGPLAA